MQLTMTLGELLIMLAVVILTVVVFSNYRDQVKRQDEREYDKQRRNRNKKVSKLLDLQERLGNQLFNAFQIPGLQVNREPEYGGLGYAVFVKANGEPKMEIYLNIFRPEGKEILVHFGESGTGLIEYSATDTAVTSLIEQFTSQLKEVRSWKG